ncbi:MobH family relaxase [Vibrio maritimus]
MLTYVWEKLKLSAKGIDLARLELQNSMSAAIIDEQRKHIAQMQQQLRELIEYPPTPSGVPIVSRSDIAYVYRAILRETWLASGMTPESTEQGKITFETTYLAVIKRMIGFYHLLPASEYNHHREVGGLLRHSLEVGLMSLRASKFTKPNPIGFQDIERERIPRWQFAAWLVGIIHDAGKIIADMEVISHKPEGLVWQPQVEDIFEWAQRESIRRYTVHWRAGRVHQEHDNLSVMLLDKLLTDDLRRWLYTSNDNLSLPLINCLRHYKQRDGYLEICLRAADNRSAEADMRTQWHRAFGKRRIGVETSIVLAMRDLYKRSWHKGMGKEHARVFMIDGSVYLDADKAIKEIIAYVNKSLNNALPIVPQGVINIMYDGGMLRRLHPYSQTCELRFTKPNKETVFKYNLVQLNWNGALFDSNVFPEDMTNATLTLSKLGELVKIDEAGRLEYFPSNIAEVENFFTGHDVPEFIAFSEKALNNMKGQKPAAPSDGKAIESSGKQEQSAKQPSPGTDKPAPAVTQNAANTSPKSKKSTSKKAQSQRALTNACSSQSKAAKSGNPANGASSSKSQRAKQGRTGFAPSPSSKVAQALGSFNDKTGFDGRDVHREVPDHRLQDVVVQDSESGRAVKEMGIDKRPNVKDGMPANVQAYQNQVQMRMDSVRHNPTAIFLAYVLSRGVLANYWPKDRDWIRPEKHKGLLYVRVGWLTELLNIHNQSATKELDLFAVVKQSDYCQAVKEKTLGDGENGYVQVLLDVFALAATVVAVPSTELYNMAMKVDIRGARFADPKPLDDKYQPLSIVSASFAKALLESEEAKRIGLSKEALHVI